MGVLGSNFLAPDVLSRAAVPQRRAGHNLKRQGCDPGHEDEDGSHRQA